MHSPLQGLLSPKFLQSPKFHLKSPKFFVFVFHISSYFFIQFKGSLIPILHCKNLPARSARRIGSFCFSIHPPGLSPWFDQNQHRIVPKEAFPNVYVEKFLCPHTQKVLNFLSFYSYFVIFFRSKDH